MKHRSIKAQDITLNINEEFIASLGELPVSKGIIGQPRAMKALNMGTEIDADGYNVFVTGRIGTGRMTAVKQILEEKTEMRTTLHDIIYVFNFEKPHKPRVLYPEKGNGFKIKQAMHDLVENLKFSIKKQLESDNFKRERDEIVSETEIEENHILSEFEGRLTRNDFQIVQIQEAENTSTDIIPVFEGEPINFEDLQKLISTGKISERYWNEKRQAYYHYMDEMKSIFLDLRIARKKMEEKLATLKETHIKPVIHMEAQNVFDELKDPALKDYLNDVEKDILGNLYLFTIDQEASDETGNPVFVRYGVNVLVDNSKTDKAPVIFENHPSYENLFGKIEYRVARSGEVRTSFMLVRAGSLIAASGGFIVMRAEELLQEPECWKNLKLSLQTGKVTIQLLQNMFMQPGLTLKPEPVQIDTKVIIIGTENLYDILYARDIDFQKLFKISAEFDSVMIRNEDNSKKFFSIVQHISRHKKLLPTDPSGMAAVLEYAIKLAEHRDRISTQFSDVADLLYEADYRAKKTGKTLINRDIIDITLHERKYLNTLPEEKLDEQVLEDRLILSVDSQAVGKINGLVIMDRGYYSFGRPVLITAQTAPGDKGIINIERESGLSGEIHDKGVFITEGFLRNRYAVDFPLSICASICFEQSYFGVDGDSASSTEIYALISSIANIPLRQDIAVSGSVNQMGEIQPVGGISQKVEGFFHVCRKKKYTGKQGVIIPERNLKNLILSTEVLEAIDAGSFAIYPIKTIDEGITILSGVESGGKLANGTYPDNTVNCIVQKKLKAMAAYAKHKS